VQEPDDCDVEFGHYRGRLDRLLIGLRAAGIESAVLELEGAHPDELWTYAEALTADDPELREQNHRAMHGTWNIWFIGFGHKPLALPMRDDVLAKLIEMTGRYGDGEIAWELQVRDRGGYLLQAHDLGNNEIFVSRRLAPKAREAIKRALGDGLTRET
jgi:hypothetical protein